MIEVFVSASAADRLASAGRWLADAGSGAEHLVVGPSREAVDDLVRREVVARGAAFGFHRFSLLQLAVRFAAVELARAGRVPSTRLGAEAVAARVLFEAQAEQRLEYFGPVSRSRGFPAALAATVEELRLAGVPPADLGALGPRGRDLAQLAEAYASRLAEGAIADRADLLALAAAGLRAGVMDSSSEALARQPLVLVDVPVWTNAEGEFVAALAERSPSVRAAVPAGDDRTAAFWRTLPDVTWSVQEPPPGDALDRLRGTLFALEEALPPPRQESLIDVGPVRFFSAPGEGRECVEIARRLHEEAQGGVPFDEMAVLLRAPALYGPLLETALRRASVPGWFARGTRAPDPAGRAFLALLACAAEGLSAARFSEYLSLGQVPPLGAGGEPPEIPPPWVAAAADAMSLGKASPGDQLRLDFELPEDGAATAAASGRDADGPVVEGTLRTPWRWDRLLVESAVIGGKDRWVRRLDGLARELEVRCEELRAEEPESSRLRSLERDLRNLGHLRRFALPLIDELEALPSGGSWGDWLEALEGLAPKVLRRPERVLEVLAELRPMAGIEHVSLPEVRDVLTDRLAQLHHAPPRHRQGRVFVGTLEEVRARAFRVVFVPGLAERIFPQKPREDPILLDAFRMALSSELLTQVDHAQRERLLLRLAVGAATERLYLSYPRMELVESRPRVPSFYALDVERALTGRVPDFEELERAAFLEAQARLGWPAPADPARAIDATEHDLAVLDGLLRHADGDRDREGVRGRARYLLEINEHLARSLRSSWARLEQRGWSGFDGLCGGEGAMAALGRHRLQQRPYSVSALQKFAVCPYQFLLSAVYRLEPRKEAVALERMDPLTRGHLFHRIQAELIRELQRLGAAPVTAETLSVAREALDRIVGRVAAQYEDDLAPAIPQVWDTEVAGITVDLRGWLQHLAERDDGWIPLYTELGFGFPPGEGRDAASRADPVVLDGGWQLHGIADLVEERPDAGSPLRVTDHKTGRVRAAEGAIVGGGEILQPVLYGLAIEAMFGRPVAESRLFYCTTAGGFTERSVPLGPENFTNPRRRGLEVLETVDRAVAQAFLPPAPREGACRWCDFLEVCGPDEERRVRRKDRRPLAELDALRSMP